MKKLAIFNLILIFIFSFSPCITVCQASFGEQYYAKIEKENVYLYSSPSEDVENRLFKIPTSYFVLLTASANDNFYSAKYANIQGYVLKKEVVPIQEQPNYPFANSSFRVFTNTSLYSEPNSTSSSLISLSPLDNITIFYGEINGEEIIPSSTNIWYYCSINQENNIYNGYIFSYFCDLFQPIQPNTEFYLPLATDIFTEKTNNNQNNHETADLSTAIIIIACVLPCLTILIIVLSRKKRKNESKYIARKRQDYFEFNQDDI